MRRRRERRRTDDHGNQEAALEGLPWSRPRALPLRPRWEASVFSKRDGIKIRKTSPTRPRQDVTRRRERGARQGRIAGTRSRPPSSSRRRRGTRAPWPAPVRNRKEALLCNRPVVATDVGDVRELLAGVEPSWICPDTPAALASADRMLDGGTTEQWPRGLSGHWTLADRRSNPGPLRVARPQRLRGLRRREALGGSIDRRLEDDLGGPGFE